MIYSVRGKLTHKEPFLAVVECAGVGYATATSAISKEFSAMRSILPERRCVWNSRPAAIRMPRTKRRNKPRYGRF